MIGGSRFGNLEQPIGKMWSPNAIRGAMEGFRQNVGLSENHLLGSISEKSKGDTTLPEKAFMPSLP